MTNEPNEAAERFHSETRLTDGVDSAKPIRLRIDGDDGTREDKHTHGVICFYINEQGHDSVTILGAPLACGHLMAYVLAEAPALFARAINEVKPHLHAAIKRKREDQSP